MNQRQKKKRYKKIHGYNPPPRGLNAIGEIYQEDTLLGWITDIKLTWRPQAPCITVAKALRERRRR